MPKRAMNTQKFLLYKLSFSIIISNQDMHFLIERQLNWQCQRRLPTCPRPQLLSLLELFALHQTTWTTLFNPPTCSTLPTAQVSARLYTGNIHNSISMAYKCHLTLFFSTDQGSQSKEGHPHLGCTWKGASLTGHGEVSRQCLPPVSTSPVLTPSGPGRFLEARPQEEATRY